MRSRADPKKFCSIASMVAMLIVVSAIDPEEAKDEAVKSLVENFLRRRGEDLQRIREALVAKNFDAIVTIGHNLRGNGASYGFPELSAIGAGIEQHGLSADVASIEREVERLTAELARVAAARSK